MTIVSGQPGHVTRISHHTTIAKGRNDIIPEQALAIELKEKVAAIDKIKHKVQSIFGLQNRLIYITAVYNMQSSISRAMEICYHDQTNLEITN